MRNLARWKTLSRSLDLFPIAQESGDALVCERMIEQQLQDLERHGRNMSAGQGALDHMQRMTQRRRQHLRLVVVVLVDLDDLANHVHAIVADIVKTSYKWAYVSRTRFRAHQSLCRREAQRHV